MKIAYLTCALLVLLIGSIHCFDMNTQARFKQYNFSTLVDITFGGYVIGASNHSYYMTADEINND